MTLQEGDVVIYIDSLRQKHYALVTAIHGNAKENPSINLVFVNAEKGLDPYGQQLDRQTSIVHIQHQSAMASCWHQIQ